MSRPNGIVYVAIIDLKGAFNTVIHDLLCRKLFELGVSSKIINILRNFYDSASVSIRSKDASTPSVKVTRGVLQGEVLSSLLFILFMSDLGTFLKDRGCIGLSIDHRTEILTLEYADDIALLVDTPMELNKKLEAFESYCKEKGLTINVQKF